MRYTSLLVAVALGIAAQPAPGPRSSAWRGSGTPASTTHEGILLVTYYSSHDGGKAIYLARVSVS